MVSKRWKHIKIAAVAIIVATLVGCSSSQENALRAAGYRNVGTTAESTIWVAGKPNLDGDYEIKVTGKLHGFCNGAVLAAVGMQICNGGDPERGSLFIIGAPATSTGGSLTLADESIVSLVTFDIPGQNNLKIAVGTASATSAGGFHKIQFTTANGEVLNREGQPQ